MFCYMEWQKSIFRDVERLLTYIILFKRVRVVHVHTNIYTCIVNVALFNSQADFKLMSKYNLKYLK